ncbi:DUF2092 domain-containing protein [Ancylobacter defluvii]|uniref:Membrane protein n=1 Tax=Ancylobacter defluvii TaxID=1282440 RepID=A0A9W6JX26_9HYPH|nr:DUF2092 domain-containing protein [Ancylobacter defluvii]MBS7587165.1 DUF2092 domain-containing protein [Ancylobacter defluvii]GLK83479.1 membrane protein [Ancylobacter defluvii]
MSNFRPNLRSKILTSAAIAAVIYFGMNLPSQSQDGVAYSKEAMEQALATKNAYDLYGIRFEFDKSMIQADTMPLLDDIAATLKQFPTWRLRITGHTDATGDAAHNDVLSKDRALAIKQALVERGIDAARIETFGIGQRSPAASNDTAEGKALNRRVELLRLESDVEGSEAAKMLRAMSDYLAAQKSISFGFDTSFEIVTKEHQKLQLASSGTIDVSRPDKLRATRLGGFAETEISFDGSKFTVLGKNSNKYIQVDMSGTLDTLIAILKNKYDSPLPIADLLSSDTYNELIADVIDAKDLGSGIIGGTECDHLAFRTKDVDWQIWIAQGQARYPCQYVITSKNIEQAPQFAIQITNWKSGDKVFAGDFSFANTTDAVRLEPGQVAELKELPENFIMGAKQ